MSTHFDLNDTTAEYIIPPKTIVIFRSLLATKPIRIFNLETQKYDYMGQILKSLNHPVQPKRGEDARFPSEIGLPLPPFTRFVRGKLLDTDLTQDILNLTPGKDAEARLVKLLSQHNMMVEFHD